MNAAGASMNERIDEPRGGQGRYIDSDATQSERNYALWTHLAGLLSIPTASLPIVGLIATIILWRARAADSPFLDDHGREATNFQISIGAYWLGGILMGAFLGIVTLGIATPLIVLGALVGPIALTILTAVGCVRGAIAASKGEYYRYPMCFRFLTEETKKEPLA